MRKIFYWLGVASAAVILVAVGGFAYLAHMGAALDKESGAYANDAAVAITSNWNTKELMSRAAPRLVQSVTAEQVSSMFEWFSVLGPLTKSNPCQGSSFVNAMIGKPSSTTAQFACTEIYQQSAATIKLALVKLDKRWMITRFNVSSPYLLTHKSTQKPL